MINFPQSTVFNKRIPKQKFYEKLNIASSIEQQFIEEIDTIYWKNKLSPETLNISEGMNVKEIEILEINLKKQSISKNIIELVDRGIPYHIIFILKFMDIGQICISYKEDSKNSKGKFRIDNYYRTEWLNYEDLSLDIEGLNLDSIYENFILQISGDRLKIVSGQLTLNEAVIKEKDIQKLESSIKRLEAKIKNEKQFNQQVKLMGELRRVKEELARTLE